MAPKVLVCDPIAEDGVKALRDAGAEVDVCLGMPAEELLAVIGEYDAVVVRSETKITAEAIAAGKRLQIIGRAGIGVDNIQVEAATERGIVVVNAPTGNVISAAEHAIALMLALARNIPQADACLKGGNWDRKRFMGVEVRGKTLGIVGLGQVGSEVARRARGLEMQVVGYDPFLPEERARVVGVQMVPLEDLLRQADFITVHTTLTESTRGLIGPEQLAMMKPTARIINTARGGIIDEEALYQAIEEGRIAGAAVDVFTKEPAVGNKLAESERIVVTPHLGASTAEAQERVAVDVAEQIIAHFRGEPVRYAVNAPLIPPETLSFLAPYAGVAVKAGLLAQQLCEGQLEHVQIEYAGEISQHDVTPLKAAVIRGLLESISEEPVNIVNANLIAEKRGLRIVEHKGPSHEIYANLITVRLTTSAGETTASATLAHDGPHIVLVNDYWVDIPPSEGYLLVCENQDRPGMIGAVGTILGDFNVNISFMNVGRHERRGNALMVLTLDEALTDEQLKKVREIPGIFSARLVRL
ncbi:MAG: phosphoglycerate dehydrogenase [Dehalococcoidia bacterium]